ncbi:MAG TPA: galactosyldiacylglycerol synthase [Opitutaceae bacterium]|jgi:processive 1,2-diacylglycerol beta-glucosyltransferase|nr:galactosyldiacylglycerol synthase [Opitutaceae bacterium]
METRIIILTAAYGEGHNAAANALATAFNEEMPGSAKVIDVFAQSNPWLNSVVRKAYLTAINRTPRLWKLIYALMDKPTLMNTGLWMLRAQYRTLQAVIEREKPSAICSSFPAYAAMLQSIRRKGLCNFPHYNIVTDSISINSVWWRPGCDGWFVPNEDTAEVMREAGADAARIHVSGFPVTPFFRNNEGIVKRPSLANGAPPRVLYIINSGTHNAEETARMLLAEDEWEVTCTVGRDEKLRTTLLAAAADRRLKADILGWTDRIPELLMSHHVVVSKAGGATTQEAVAARCPMIVNQVVPGQEEGNCELLLRHEAGALATTPAAVLSTLKAAFADKGRGWSAWRAALGPMARPDAARTVALHVLAQVDGTKGDERKGVFAAAL